MKALIVVDMQKDFMDDGNLPVPGAYDLVEEINSEMASGDYDLIVATQDWHPPEHKSFASNHEGKNEGDFINLNGLEQILWPDHCVQGTEGAEFVEGLRTDLFDKVFQKGTNPEVDSYSGFYDNGHREDTGLADYLREQGVTGVQVCGVALNFCCFFSVLDSLEEGFGTDLLVPLSEGINIQEGDVDRAIEEMEKAGASIIREEDL